MTGITLPREIASTDTKQIGSLQWSNTRNEFFKLCSLSLQTDFTDSTQTKLCYWDNLPSRCEERDLGKWERAGAIFENLAHFCDIIILVKVVEMLGEGTINCRAEMCCLYCQL